MDERWHLFLAHELAGPHPEMRYEVAWACGGMEGFAPGAFLRQMAGRPPRRLALLAHMGR